MTLFTNSPIAVAGHDIPAGYGYRYPRTHGTAQVDGVIWIDAARICLAPVVRSLKQVDIFAGSDAGASNISDDGVEERRYPRQRQR